MKKKQKTKSSKSLAHTGLNTTFDDIISASVSNPPIPQKTSKKSSFKATKPISKKGNKSS